MSLFRKLVILFGVVMLVVLSTTLAIVYSESRRTIIALSGEKAVSIIQTIDSALLSNVPDYQFENVLLHLKKQDPNIISFDIYKLNDSLYDIASTNPQRIGTQASPSSVVALGSKRPITNLQGNVMQITVPITGYAGGIYDANVKFSIADDLRSNRNLLIQVLLIGISAIILAILSAWLFTREFLSKPVLAIVAAVNDVATGNLHVDLSQFKRRRDEIGHLSRSFDLMATTLRQLMRRMAETAHELSKDFEQLVKHGDYTATGALHVSDVINHVAKSITEQEAQLLSLKSQIDWTTGGDKVVRSTRRSQVALMEDVGTWLTTVDAVIERTREMADHLQAITSTANGQLGAIQEVNRTAARLSQMASELREQIATFETT
ncbi:HAMP domain-containing protein [Alicyclobacillus acidiphilus]|uniref:HAMP domain-containing protein n=1 Tax=Alicyclobacillus acidiphilus TaxID=182455 RepID=UPI00082BE6A6|nr:methyl-accepting chemotaxis protein [Alicyclobacillus acidiphilus]